MQQASDWILSSFIRVMRRVLLPVWMGPDRSATDVCQACSEYNPSCSQVHGDESRNLLVSLSSWHPKDHGTGRPSGHSPQKQRSAATKAGDRIYSTDFFPQKDWSRGPRLNSEIEPRGRSLLEGEGVFRPAGYSLRMTMHVNTK